MSQISFFEPTDKTVFSTSSDKLKQKTHILSVLEDCHNYIYANEGVLKEKAFREIIKILFIKIYVEKHINDKKALFKITKKEYQNIFKNKPCKEFNYRIKTLYQELSKASSLKIWNEKVRFSEKAMAYIVNRLQSISLSNISGDIAGQAFQTFIHHHQRGERGEFFTPLPVVELAIQMLQPGYNERLIDPACGSGGFLLTAIRYVEKSNPQQKMSFYVTNNIYGIEFNPDVAFTAKLLLEIEGGKESNISCENSLNTEGQHGLYDIVLTNPPFGRRGRVEDPAILNKYDLGKKWINTSGNIWNMRRSILSAQPPEILFIEKCLKLLKPEGRMAIVLPDGVLQNPSLAFVRHWIKFQASIIGVVSLPQETFVPFGTGVKTSLVLLRKNFQKKNIFFSKIKNIGYDIKGNTRYKNYFNKATNTDTKKNNNDNLQCIKSDIDQVINTFHNQKKQYKSPAIAWKIKYDLLADRWDAEHYSLRDMQMIDKLNSNRTLSNFVEIVKHKERLGQYPLSAVKYVAISDIDRHGMKIVTHQMFQPNKLPLRASYKIQEGDILLAISGANTGTEKQAVAIVTKDYEGSICSNGFAVLRNISNIDKYFFLAFLKTDVFIKQVRRMMTGHAIPCISPANLCKVVVPVPSKKIQENIAKRTKQIIALSQRQQREINSLKKEIHLWFSS